MDSAMIDTHLETLDHRLARIEQILPTLVTKDDLKAHATSDELRAEHDRLRLDMRILIEHQDGKLQLIAEHVSSLLPKPRTE